ncbi:MAG TPA: tetratricopeptide repeat protein [Gemmatimonadaceae bacterium]|nr:tetratricopeptide repeat protein [Gemmatimonadaceae bacterium]
MISRRVLFLLLVAVIGCTPDSRPVIESPSIRYDESEVRDRDIDFYSKRVSEDPESAIDRFTLAKLLFARSRMTGSTSDIDHAERLVKESISKRTQRNYSAFELLASLLMARHEFRAARDVALRADSLDPGNSSHLALLGEIELELGDYKSAAKHFAAIQYDGRNFTTGARLARWYELTGRIDVAREFLKRAIVRVDRRDDLPRDQVAWFYYRLGDLELRTGNVAAAESAFVSGLARNPDDVRVLGGLARAALARDAWQQAVDYGERATANQLDPATLGTISLAYAKLGDSAQAASYARAMSVSALKQPGAIHRAWGLFFLDHGTAADRADVLRRARKELRDRKDVYGHDLMAWALYRNGQLDKSKQEMKLALSQHTQDVMLIEHARAIGVWPATQSPSGPR